MLRRAIERIGNSLPRPVRRLVLDRLGGARAAAWLGGRGFETTRLSDSVVLFLKPLLHSGLSRNGRIYYEDNLVEIVKERVTGGSVFYDVGANVGIFSFVAGLCLGQSGKVIAFEPEPNNAACLKRSIEFNQLPCSIRLMEIAVTDVDGFVAFDRRGGAFSGRVVNRMTARKPSTAVVDVRARSIDSLVEAGEIPAPDFVKIDVEGGEGHVLSGMRHTLATHSPEIFLEMHHFASVEQAYSVLDSNGYRLFRADAFVGGPLPLLTSAERAHARHVLALPPVPV